ncbi:hypothetical protein HBA12_07340 [Tenacibaculum mesophilum]|uniref:hypothetical protein n=1 Tax=Tenacibaculum mesophilum TaxID=104268 RepID=UPI001431DF3E|nr:hypothetical protein [Tenacibaculum mesophilum]KAF9660041.1 hypothetical protein HBA12_07340 [Tenacibaculum mesophilum]
MKKRNKQIANLLKLGVFLFGISLLLSSCEKDEIIPNTHTDNTTKPYTLATLNYKELTHDAEFSKSLKKIEKNLSTKNVSSKGSTGKKRLSILTNQIAKIKTKTTISWTFKLENTLKEASVFENLLVRKYNNEFSYFLVSYQGENNTNNGKNTEKSLLYSLSKEDFDFSELDIQARSDSFDTPGEDDGDYGGGGGSTPCDGVWIPEYKSCDAGGNADGHSPQKQWDGSYCSRSQLTGYVIDFSHCTNYTPPGGPSNDIPTDDTSSGGGGSGSSIGGGTVITTPVEDADGNTYTEAQIRTNNINRTLDNSLSLSELNFLSDSNNLVTTKEVEAFLFKNTTSEAKTFAEQAIKALANGGEVDFEEQIINKLTGKAKCVYEKLKSNSLIKKTLQEFDGTDALINLLIEEKDIEEEGVSGETSYGIPIKITLDTPDMNNTPSLWGAYTIIHEAIHADIYRKVFITGGLLYTPPNTYTLNGTRADFPTLFDYYDNYPNNAHHNYMADYYRTAMEKGLKEYATLIGKTYPNQLYKDLAWAGLHNTKAWDNMYADPIYTRNEQRRILNSINNFKNSGTNECN